MKKPTRERICAVVLKLLDKSGDGNGVSIRRVAAEVGITPMAIYKHFPNRDALLKGATSAEYKRIGAYFERANARKNVKGLRGMLGYLDYALDHPNLFQYMFSRVRADTYVFPGELNAGKSPTMNILYSFVGGAMESGILRKDDVFETSLSIWAHAHGVIMLYLAGRIELPKGQLRNLYLRSLNRLLDGLTAQPHKAREILKRGQMRGSDAIKKTAYCDALNRRKRILVLSEVIAPGGYGPWMCRLSGLSTNSVQTSSWCRMEPRPTKSMLRRSSTKYRLDAE